MPEVLFFFRCFDISIFQGKFLSVYTLSDLVNETCFIELLSIVRHRGLLKVSNFRLETINMNSVFDLLSKETVVLRRWESIAGNLVLKTD